MKDTDFIKLCKKTVRDYANMHADKSDNVDVGLDDVYVVWLCKALKNSKALLSTTLPDGMYYECTYNGDTNEMYVDCYKKWENFTVGRSGIDEALQNSQG